MEEIDLQILVGESSIKGTVRVISSDPPFKDGNGIDPLGYL